jgi:hypothetical protein
VIQSITLPGDVDSVNAVLAQARRLYIHIVIDHDFSAQWEVLGVNDLGAGPQRAE